MGAWTISLQQWQARDAVVYVPRPEGPAICSAVRRHEASRLNAMPAVWQRVLDTLEEEGGQLPSIRLADSGTSATPPPLLAAIAKACPNAWIRIFYGSTEAGNVASLTGDDVFRKPGSCGLPSQATEARIDPGNGELCVTRSAAVRRLLRKSRRDRACAAGRLVSHRRSGGRRRRGISQHRGTRSRRHPYRRGIGGPERGRGRPCQAFPARRRWRSSACRTTTWGEIVCAVVVAQKGDAPPSLAAARERCIGKLAAFKHPRALRVVSELPRTPATNQLQRRLIVEALVKEESAMTQESRITKEGV